MANGVDKKLGGGGHKQEAFDKSTGRYVSNDLVNNSIVDLKDIHLKPGIKLDFSDYKSKKKEEANKTPIFASVEEAEKFANDALAKHFKPGQTSFTNKIVYFSHKCELQSAQEMTEAIVDVSKDFPKLMKNLVNFGDSQKEKEIPKEEKAHKIVLEVVKEHINKYGQNDMPLFDLDIMSNFLLSLNYIIKKHKNEYKNYPNTSGITSAISLDEGKSFFPLSVISLNKRGTQHYEANKINVDNSIANKFSVSYGNKGPIYGTAAHELGHFIDNNLGFTGFRDDEKKYMRKLYKEVMHNPELKKQVSGYAQTDSKEMLAECVSDWYCNKEHAQPISIKIFNFLKKVYDREFGGK